MGEPQVGRIEDYAVVGDLHTMALISRTGSVDWLCLPHFDSPACFAALLDTPSAGRWALHPTDWDADGVSVERSYEADTLVLVTTWTTPQGTVRVTDFMPVRDRAADLVRIVEGVEGTVEMASIVRLRFEYGRRHPGIDVSDNTATAVAGADSTSLHAEVPLRHEDGAIVAEFTVAAGESAAFTLSHVPTSHSHPSPHDPRHQRDRTMAYWRDWISTCTYEGRWSDAVRRALLTLKALTYDPTGGIAAAATTSLPEEVGGVRNWDYRYCWLRDATLTLEALIESGFHDEAKAWRAWLLRAVAGDPAQTQIMYGIDGRSLLGEMELSWLAGYEKSAPVRIGNAAADQHQLDVWGEVLDGLHLARHARLHRRHDDSWGIELGLMDWLESHWQAPDNGLWEMRGPQRHFVHSKVMAWVGVDRMVRSAEHDGLDGPVERWRALRDEIHQEVCERGFDPARNTFTQFYGSKGLDASLLLIPRVGFLPWDDPRVRGTVEAVRRELASDGLVLRYDAQADSADSSDGLPGGEGAFLACSFWLVDALHGIGEVAEAEKLFEHLLEVRNDVGLLSEEWDPVAGRQVGNTPQAFSLVGLVNSARTLGGTQPAGCRPSPKP